MKILPVPFKNIHSFHMLKLRFGVKISSNMISECAITKFTE